MRTSPTREPRWSCTSPGSASASTEQIQALKQEESIHAERFAWDKLCKAHAKEAKGVASRSARKSVRYAHSKVVKSHGDTVAAKIAQQRLAALGSD